MYSALAEACKYSIRKLGENGNRYCGNDVKANAHEVEPNELYGIKPKREEFSLKNTVASRIGGWLIVTSSQNYFFQMDGYFGGITFPVGEKKNTE